MRRTRIADEYFDWLCDVVCGERFSEDTSYIKLLTFLHNTEFRYIIRRDSNRAAEGVGLRQRYSWVKGCEDVSEYLAGPCSMLEMMVALAINCEDIMDDPALGDRTGQWFWGMIASLNLNSMTDERFDCRYVDAIVQRFLDRDYAPDGRGGLFRIRNCDYDLRDMEIWHQMCCYLNSISPYS